MSADRPVVVFGLRVATLSVGSAQTAERSLERLAAVHPWDIQGAGRAGLSTAWINRTGARYLRYFRAPDAEHPHLLDFAASV